jgi:hypothetical protein
MDFTPLLCVIRALEGPLLFLIGGLLVAIPTTVAIFVVSQIGHVDLPIVLLLLRGPLPVGVKESSPGLECLVACVCD